MFRKYIKYDFLICFQSKQNQAAAEEKKKADAEAKAAEKAAAEEKKKADAEAAAANKAAADEQKAAAEAEK